jgi:hypothetical protein
MRQPLDHELSQVVADLSSRTGTLSDPQLPYWRPCPGWWSVPLACPGPATPDRFSRADQADQEWIDGAAFDEADEDVGP